MRYEVLYGPAYSVLRIDLEPGESVEAEAGALMMMEGDVEIKTRSRGLLRAIAASESLFVNEFRAKERSSLWLVPPVPGDIIYARLDGSKGLIVNDTAYIASHGRVEHKPVWRGLKGAMGRGGLVWLRLSGVGGVWLGAYGGIVEKEVKPGDKLTIDNTHLLAMDDTLDYEIKKLGGLKTFLLGGEGFVFTVRGHGRIYLQTRSPAVFYSASR